MWAALGSLKNWNRCTLSGIALIDKKYSASPILFILIKSMDKNWVIIVKWRDGIGKYPLEVHNMQNLKIVDLHPKFVFVNYVVEQVGPYTPLACWKRRDTKRRF